MKSRLFLILLPFVALLLAGCAKNEVRLVFELPADVNEPCRIVYYASGSNVGMVRETAVEIASGKGETVLPLQYPAIVYLFSPSSRQPAAMIYARRGESFKVTGTNATVGEWNISGNDVTDELSHWRIANAALIKSRDREPERLNTAVAKYVKANPGSEAAAIVLYHYFSRRDNEREFFRLQSLLDRNVTGNEMLMTALSQADLLAPLPDRPSMPRRIILVSDSGYADTLALGKGKGLLLLFRGADDPGYSNDSVKSLAREIKNHRMAELYMEPDSFNWRRYLRRDTIRDIERLWMPLGLTDSVALQMGVRRTPYFMVISPKGKEVYRGADWDSAVYKFRSLKP